MRFGVGVGSMRIFVAVSREGFVLFFLDLESGEVKEERLGLLCFGWLCIRFVPHRIFRGGFFFRKDI